MTLLIGFLGAALAAVATWRLLRSTLSVPVFERENYRGATLPTAAGLILAVVALGGEALATVLDVDEPSEAARRTVLLAALGFAFLGLIDDLAGVGESRGFRGHLSALRTGRLTTGGLKLCGGAALALAVVPSAGAWRWLADAALVALAANLANLLDRAPGRVVKASLVIFAVLVATTSASAELLGVAVVVGASAGLLFPDLRERLMLGDTGANPLGAVLGLAVVLNFAPVVRTVALSIVLALNLASEVVSFSAVIDRFPPMRALDRAGRARS